MVFQLGFLSRIFDVRGISLAKPLPEMDPGILTCAGLMDALNIMFSCGIWSDCQVYFRPDRRLKRKKRSPHFLSPRGCSAVVA